MKGKILFAPDDGRGGGKPQGVDMGMLPDLVGYALRCAQVAVFQHFSEAVGETAITPPQFGAMVMIEANSGISQSAIATALRFDRSTLVQIIDKLEARKLVIRDISTQDRRSHALKLTPAGADMIRDLKRKVAEHEAQMTRHLDDTEKAILLDLLGKIRA